MGGESLASRWRVLRGVGARAELPNSRTWRNHVDSAVASALSICAAGFFVLLVVGVVRWYSPAPLADSWDGCLNFYLRVQEGRVDPWFSPSNEHRLIFSRLCFWIDHRFFGGLHQFLIALNVALAVASWGVLCVAASKLFSVRSTRWNAFALLALCCFSWVQHRNFTWAYQSQFFAAYLFPLTAFVCLARASEAPRSRVWLALAAVFAALAATSMANGILAAPLLAVMALLDAPRRARRWIVLGVFAALLPWLYFRGYAPRPTPETTPSVVLAFTLEFLGAPLKHAFDERSLAIAAGGAIVGVVALGAWVWARQSAPRDPWLLALLVFLIYIALSGAAAGYRRAGLGAAESGAAVRYATAAVMAWSAALLVVLRSLRGTRVEFDATWLAGVGLVACLTPLQLSALDHRGPSMVRAQRVAVLALDLGVNDPKSARLLYANDRFLPVAAEARERGVGFFGLPEMVRAREAIGRPVEALGFVRCDGRVFVRQLLDRAPDGMLVRGWAYDRVEGRTPDQIFLADARGIVLGAAFTGRPRADSEQLIGRVNEPCDFDGYLVGATDEPLELFHRPAVAHTVFPELQASERR